MKRGELLFCNSTSVHLMYDVFEERKTKMIKKIFLLGIMIFRKIYGI